MERKQDLSWLKNWRVLTLWGGGIVAGFLLGMLIFGSPWHLPPAWGDIPTWITGIATAGLLTGVIITPIQAAWAAGLACQKSTTIYSRKLSTMMHRTASPPMKTSPPMNQNVSPLRSSW